MFRPSKPGADGQARKPPSEDKAALSEGKRLERCLEDCRAAGDEKAALSYRNRVCAHYKRLLVERPLACWEAQIDIRLWRAVFYRRLKELQGEKKASGGKFPPSSTQQRVVDFVREGTTFYKEILEELLWAGALMEGKQSNRCFRQPSDAKDGGGSKPASAKPRAPANAATALRALCAQAQARVGDLLRHRAALCSADVVRDEEESAAAALAAAAATAAGAEAAQEEEEEEGEEKARSDSARAAPQACVAESARDWYLKAHRTLPEGGHPHNQLAVLAFGSTAPEATLEAVLRLYLALACDEPFTSARENLVKFYGTVLGGERRPPADPSGHRVAALQRPWHATIKERPAAGTHETTVASVMARLAPHLLHLHAMAFTGIGLERHAPTADLVGGLYRVLLSSTAFHQDPELLVNLMALNIFLVRNATYHPPGCQPDERHGMRVAATRRLALETCFTLWAVMVDVLREEAVFEPASYVFLTWLAGYDEPPAGGGGDGGDAEQARPLLLNSLIAAVGAEELLPRLASVLRSCETYYAAEGGQNATEEWAPEEISLEGFTHVPLLRKRPPRRGGGGGGGEGEEEEEDEAVPEAEDEDEEGLQRSPRVAARDCGALLARRLRRLQPLVFELLRGRLLAREEGALASLVEPVAVPSFAVALPSMKPQGQQPAAAGVAPTLASRVVAGAGRGRGGAVGAATGVPLQPRGVSPSQAPAAGEPTSPSAGGQGGPDPPVVKVVHKTVSAAAAAAAQSDAAAAAAVAATWSHNGPGLMRAPTDMTVSTEDDEVCGCVFVRRGRGGGWKEGEWGGR